MMKKVLFTIGLLAITTCTFAAHNYSFESGGIFYNITSSANLTVEVTYGKEYGEYFGVVDIPQKTSNKGVYYTVTRIGNHAFSGCSGLTKVNFPVTVTTIGDYAFSGCNAMTEMIIPATVTGIGNYVFNSCSSLKSITFEYSKASLSLGYGTSKGSSYGLFSDCPIETISLPRGLNYNTSSNYGYSPFAKHPTLKSIVYTGTNSGSYMCYECKQLSSVSLPDGFVTINDYAFYGCSSLKDIKIPDNVTSIGNSAFRNCYGFHNFTISSGVSSIGDYCFAGCKNLQSFTIPGNVTSIGNYAFSGCTAIASLTFEYGPSTLSLGYGASKGDKYGLFYDCPLESINKHRGLNYSTSSNYGYSPFANHPTLTTVTLKEGTQNTGSYMFYNCDALTTINLPQSLTSVSDYSFYSCGALKSIDIPDNVTSLGASSFRNCINLKSFTVSPGIESIGEYCFAGCISFKSFTIPGNVTKIGNYAFSGCTDIKYLLFEVGPNKNLSLGYGASKGDKYGLFYDCPLDSITLRRGLNYSTSSNYGYSPFANHPTLKSVRLTNLKNMGSYLFYGDALLTEVKLPNNLVIIDDYDFCGCKSLTTIDIPSTVTTIGNSAFRNCNWFTSFTIGSGVESIGNYCFAGCVSLDSFTIPGNVTSIGNYAFSGCTRIKEVTFEKGPNKNLSIGHGCSKGEAYSLFYDCPLESVALSRGLSYNTSSSYGYSPFANHPTLKSFTFDHINNTGSYMLYGCGLLTSVKLGPTMVEINDYAFANCKSLSSIDIPETLTTIGNSAFRNCNWFTSFTIGSGVESIGNYCFSGCISLDSFTIPGNVTSIGNYAFSGCTRIKEVTLEPGTYSLKLGYGASGADKYGLFYDCPLNSVTINRTLSYNTSSNYGYSPFAYNNTLEKVTLGEGATRIGNYLFYGDKALTSVSMAESVTGIGNYTFYACTGLSSLKIGEGVETIGEYAFSNCTNLTGLIFKPALKNIGNYAFRNCTSFNNFAIEESSETLTLGNGTSEGEKTGLFKDCPLTSVFIGRDLSYNYSPLYGIKTLTEARFGNPVTRIPNYILQACSELSAVYFNKSCQATVVGKYAFSKCPKLTSLELPEGITTYEEGAFWDCTGFKSFQIGEKVETIGIYCFDGCSQLTGLIFHPALKSIGNYAFRNCTSFNNFAIEESDEKLTLGNGSSAGEKTGLFNDCPLTSVFIGRNLSYSYAPLYGIKTLTEARFGNPVTRIPNYILQDCSELSAVYFNKSCQATAVGKYAFSNCPKLPTPDFPETVTAFEEGAFQGCTSFTNFDMPATLTSIGDYTFSGCTGLTAFTVPATVTNIGNYAFSSCSSITTINMVDGEETLVLGYGASKGKAYGLFYDCPLETVYRGRGLSYSSGSTYGYSPFANIKTLKRMTLGEQVTGVGAYYLYGDEALEEFVMTDKLQSLKDYSLYGCKSLTSLTLPASLKSVGNYVFNGCTSLTSLTIEDGNEVLTMGYGSDSGNSNTAGKGLFYDCPLTTLYLGRTLSYTEKKANGYSPFAYINSLKEVTIGNKVSSLGYCILYSTGIQELYIPSSVRSVHSSALNNCTNLKRAIILGATPPSTDTYNTMLSNSAEGSKFYVFFPEKYKSANIWKNYADRIEPICTFTEGFTYNGSSHTLKYETTFPITLSNMETEVEAGNYTKHIEVAYQTNGYHMEDVLNYAYSIGQAVIDVSVDNVERFYGEENPEFEITLYGMIDGEDASVLEAQPVASTKATKTSDVGTYDITISGAKAKNYTFNYLKGTLTILKAPQEIIWEYPEDLYAVGASVELTAYSTSGLAIEYSTDDSGCIQLSKKNGRIYATCKKEGSAKVTASQPGNKNYEAAESLVWSLDIVPTSIGSINAEATSDTHIYNMAGQRLSKPQKGVNIINGKKVAIK